MKKISIVFLMTLFCINHLFGQNTIKRELNCDLMRTYFNDIELEIGSSKKFLYDKYLNSKNWKIIKDTEKEIVLFSCINQTCDESDTDIYRIYSSVVVTHKRFFFNEKGYCTIIQFNMMEDKKNENNLWFASMPPLFLYQCYKWKYINLDFLNDREVFIMKIDEKIVAKFFSPELKGSFYFSSLFIMSK